MSNNQDIAIRLLRVLRYNRNRIEKALSLFSSKKRPIFNALPFLLHINHPELPGYVEDEATPYGLAFFSYRRGVQEALFELFPQQSQIVENPKPIWPRTCFIESLSLMGSIGTTAQSDKSDLDYWVCVDGNKVDAEGWQLLQQKLTLIETWAWEEHKLEVHFFLSDIDKVRNNDFGEADGESAGSAQPTFLKNEYYCTSILISGRIPFWWIAPFDCTNAEYQQYYDEFQHCTEPNPKHFIDLGNIDKLEPNEVFGATIWQLTKAMDSPFKSVLKMAKLEVYTDQTQLRRPLCNVLKGRIHQGVNLDKDYRSVDPYALMFDTIIDYYSKTNPKFLELFKCCLYIKSHCLLTQTMFESSENTTNFKRQIIADYVKNWGWQRGKIEMHDRIDDWDFQQVSHLGKQIHSFLIGCYRRLSAKLQGHKQLVSVEDMTVIGRKIDSFYSTKDGKIQYLKRAFEEGLAQPDITITMELDITYDTKQRWSAYRGRRNYPDTVQEMSVNPYFLKASSDPVDLVLWCIFNRITTARSRFYLLQSKLTISRNDIEELMNEALFDYKPIRVSELPREQLLAPVQVIHCVVVVNFSSYASEVDVQSLRVVYLTSWGELYSVAGYSAFMELKAQMVQQTELPVCRLFTLSRNKRRMLYRQIEAMTEFEFDKVGG